jgi:ABC-2 type transport system permease protein
MKALCIAKKALLELWREPLNLAILLGFPILLILFYYIAFGQTDQGLAKYLTVLVVNEDAGGTTTVDDKLWPAGSELIALMREAEYEGQPIFNVSIVADRHAAEISLRERKASLLLIIPPDFTQALIDASSGAEGASPAIVTLVGDTTSDAFVFARSMLDGLVREFVGQTAGWEETTPVTYEFLPGTGTMSDFEFGVPGVIVFGLVLLVVTTAQILVRENVNGTLQRLRLTRARATDLLLGVSLAQMAVALVIVPLTFGAAKVFGFQGNGSLLLATGIGLLFSLPVVGLGLMTACFARNDGEAANLGASVGVIMVLVSGAMYPMPAASIATIAGRAVQIYDLLPSTHAAEAMRQVLILGEGPGAILYELTALVILSVVFLVAGVGLYQRLQLQMK